MNIENKNGRLKIFFGYAAGVGKTYAMLEAAHQAKQEGIDVVVGYVERHTRPDTLKLLDGLEAIPTCEIDYRGIRLKEFDLDGALRRAPELILVDELAHSNAQGSRHTKRYQDIEELLRAGIDVYTTVNVQHLESLNDLVSSITGIVVNERIPDRVFDLAGQVELVDIDPSDLVKRLKAGKVYPERQAKRALEHFFTGENLAALREIAMRRTADRLNRAAVQDGNTQSARAGEHILICLSSAPSNPKVIRTAARMSEAFHSGFTALFVQTPETKELSGENMKRLRANLHLAEQLGAQIATVYGTDPADQIAEYARVSGVTKIVMGRMNHKPNMLTGTRSLADRLLEQTDLDVYIIPDKQPIYKKPMARVKRPDLSFRWQDSLKTVLILVLATIVSSLFFYAGFSESNLITVYLLGVLLTAVWTGGQLYGAAASLMSVGAFNFFFTEPRFSFEAYDPSDPVTFLVMLISSFLAASLAGRVKVQAQLSAEKSYYTQILLGSSQKLQQGRTELECLRLAAEQLNRLFERPILYSLSEKDRPLHFYAEPAENGGLEAELGSEEMGVAMWVRKNNKHAGATTHTLPDSKWLFMSVRGTQGVIGVVGVPIVGYGVPDAFEKNLMISILSQCGLSMERIRLEAEKNQAALHAQKEHLQAHLLRAVSHDLRTPLTSISGSAGMLMECSGALEEEERQRLYEGIYFDSGWLIDLTENLLAATRLESTQGALKLQPELIEDVFAEALRKLEHRVRKHHISIVMEDPALMARMDTNLILRVVINIINNALQYTPEGSDVVLSARRAGQYAQVSIADNGPGIPREEREHLFDLFYTASQGKGDSHRGMGLGLNLCRTIIKRHNGEIEVLENHPRGTIFRFILPISNETRTN